MACNLSVNSLEKGKERKGQTTGKGRGLRRDRERKEFKEPETVFVPRPPRPGRCLRSNETLFFVFILLPTMHAIFVGEDATKVNEISL